MSAELRMLIERTAGATGPDRDVDLLIAIFFGAVSPHTRWSPQGFGYVDRNQWAVSVVPQYTGSVDAALTLLPEDWASVRQHQHRYADSSVGCFAEVDVPERSCFGDRFEGPCPTPAIALCLAIFSARGIG